LFPDAENVHLIKDVGMIAYKLHKLYNVEARLACFDNDNYTYQHDIVKGIKIDIIEKKYNNYILDVINYLKNSAKKIDVLHVFHITLRTAIYIYVYKFFNRKGRVFLKLDCTERLIEVINSLSPIKRLFLNNLLHEVDIIGAEQKRIYNELINLLPKAAGRITYLPNGIDYQGTEQYRRADYFYKQDMILNVGRIGSPEKATEILLKAFAMIDGVEKTNWKLVLVGPIEESFNDTIDMFFKECPHIKEKVEFTGAVYNRERLNDLYMKAKIYCSSSKYESFGLSLLESASFGNIIVSTKVGIANELVEGGAGEVVKVDEVKDLSAALETFMNCENLKVLSEQMKDFCRKNYNWDEIVSSLYSKLTEVDSKAY
jgi:L-malate glycosyltransferase